jgi:hypothetical protein
MRSCVFILYTLLLSATGLALDLVQDGKNALPLVLPADASGSTKEAAKELSRWIGAMSGAKSPIITSGSGDLPKSAIWIGHHEELKDLFPGVNFTLDKPEEILIVSKGGNLAILGRDREVKGVEQESGTSNAIYTFAAKYLGVRWLWPGAVGEDILEKKTVSVPEFEFRFHPIFVQRAVFRNLSKAYRPLREWCTRQRIAHDSFDFPAGHAFDEWWDRYGKDHPEYFALQPDGTRGTFPEQPNRKKLCDGEPDVWDRWMVEVGEQLEKNPAQRIFNTAANDSTNSGLCVDSRSTAWDHAGAAQWTYAWANENRLGPAMSNRFATFANTLGRMIRQKYPDQDYYVTMMAYGPSKPAPLDLAIEKNVAIGYVGHFPMLEKNRRDIEKAEFADWGKLSHNIIYRPNISLYTGGYHALPAVTFGNTIEDFRFLAENGCRGLVFDTLLDHWSTQGPMYYLMAEMAWDPMLDGQALLDDYYSRGFGPAAGSIRAYFELMEKAHETIYNRADWLPSGRMYIQLSDRNMIQDAWSPKVLAEARALLDQAARETVGQKKFSERVAFVAKGLDFSEKLIATMNAMNRVRESQGKDYEAVAEAQKLVGWREGFLRGEDAAAKATASIPPINSHRFNVTFLRSRKVEDYLGPVSETFKQAAATEKANPTIKKLNPADLAVLAAAAAGKEFRWTGKTGNGLWAEPGNWETRTPDGWLRASSPPKPESSIILGNEAPPNQRTISLNTNASASRVVITATGQDAGYIIQSTNTADAGNADSDSGMVYTLTLSDDVPLQQEFGTSAPLRIQTSLRFTGPKTPSIALKSTSGAFIELAADVHPPNITESYSSGSSKGRLIFKKPSTP